MFSTSARGTPPRGPSATGGAPGRGPATKRRSIGRRTRRRYGRWPTRVKYIGIERGGGELLDRLSTGANRSARCADAPTTPYRRKGGKDHVHLEERRRRRRRTALGRRSPGATTSKHVPAPATRPAPPGRQKPGHIGHRTPTCERQHHVPSGAPPAKLATARTAHSTMSSKTAAQDQAGKARVHDPQVVKMREMTGMEVTATAIDRTRSVAMRSPAAPTRSIGKTEKSPSARTKNGSGVPTRDQAVCPRFSRRHAAHLPLEMNIRKISPTVYEPQHHARAASARSKGRIRSAMRPIKGPQQDARQIRHQPRLTEPLGCTRRVGAASTTQRHQYAAQIVTAHHAPRLSVPQVHRHVPSARRWGLAQILPVEAHRRTARRPRLTSRAPPERCRAWPPSAAGPLAALAHLGAGSWPGWPRSRRHPSPGYSRRLEKTG